MGRRKTRTVRVGDVLIGGDAPVSVQSMTKTRTEDVDATLRQIEQLAEAGCEIVRCAVPRRSSIAPLKRIASASPIPVVADIHFDPGLAIEAVGAGVDGVRINPCTMSDRDQLATFYRLAGARGIKVRIGINSGSVRTRRGLEVAHADDAPDTSALMVDEALRHGAVAEDNGCSAIVLSLKASTVRETVRAYRMAAERCDYPFHVGLTAAGPPDESRVKSAIGIGALLLDGIGDTVRVSMTGPPHHEVHAAYDILHALELRERREALIVSCPTCGRCEIDLVDIVERVQKRLAGRCRGLRVAIMGCVVNGPGEAAEADIGVAGGKESGVVFRRGKKIRKVEAAQIVDALVQEAMKEEAASWE